MKVSGNRLTCDMAGFAHADDNDAASAVKQAATGVDKAAVDAVAEGF